MTCNRQYIQWNSVLQDLMMMKFMNTYTVCEWPTSRAPAIVCNRLCKATQHCVQVKGSMSRLPEDVTFLLRIEVDNRECLSTSRWFTEYCTICMHADWMSNRNTISDCYIHDPRKILSLAPVEACISRENSYWYITISIFIQQLCNAWAQPTFLLAIFCH